MRILALDIGGANIKAAQAPMSRTRDIGRQTLVRTLPFALWMEPAQLRAKLNEAVAGWPCANVVLVTMTAELCDCFATRAAGVLTVLDAVCDFAGERPVRVWSTAGQRLEPAQVRRDPLAAASANWHVQAAWLARLYPLDASLVIDIGSTTTDIIVLDRGRIRAARTDADRLRRGELVYVGADRTPLMAIPIRRRRSRCVPVMAERFATTADVYVLTGERPQQPRRRDTADGRPLTRKDSVNRVLRMIGSDRGIAGDAADSRALQLAEEYSRGVDERVAAGVSLTLHRCFGTRKASKARKAGNAGKQLGRVIVTGSGDFIAARVAAQMLPGVPVVALRDSIGRKGSEAACAWAMLQLWNRDEDD